ncbi:hypothetical protein K7432_009593, partial [Basidiobolus ranarum]
GLLGVMGMVVICINKSLLLKQHFKTYHGLLGMLVIIIIVGQLIFGLWIYLFSSKERPPTRHYRLHRILGYMATILLWITTLLGTQSNWMSKQSDCLWIWFPVIGLILVGILTRIRPKLLK